MSPAPGRPKRAKPQGPRTWASSWLVGAGAVFVDLEAP